MQIEVKGWFRIPRTILPVPVIEQCMRDLTVKSKVRDFVTNEEKPPRLLYCLDEQYLSVPPYYAFNNLKQHIPQNLIKDLRTVGHQRPRLKRFTGTLDEEMRKQESAHKAIMQALNTELGVATLALPPGDGKTVSSLKVVSDIGLRTLVVVHKKHLNEQWQERVNEYLPDAEVSEMYADELPDPNADVVVVTVQSLYKNKYLWLDAQGNTLDLSSEQKEYYIRKGLTPEGSMLNTFGLMIIDEAHNYSAKCFSVCLWMLQSRHKLALSGTPKRKDGMHIVLENFLGPVTFATKKKYAAKPLVRFFKMKCECADKNHLEPLTKRIGGKKRADRVSMLGEMAKCPQMTQFVFDQMKCYLMSDQRRNFLVLSERLKVVRVLKTLFARDSDIKAANIGVDTFIGEDNEEHRKRVRSDAHIRVILSNYQMAKEALDIARLNCVVLVTPASDAWIEQAVNRCIRTKDPSFRPLVMDFVHMVSIWLGCFRDRCKYFRREEFELDYSLCPYNTASSKSSAYDLEEESDNDDNSDDENPFL